MKVNTDYIGPDYSDVNVWYDKDAVSYPPSQIRKRCQKYARAVSIFPVLLIILCVRSEQKHNLDSRECCAHRATYSCLGNINHFILTADFSYCEKAFRSEVPNMR